MNFIEAIDDSAFFQPLFIDLNSWRAWMVVMKAIFGLRMSEPERALFTQLAAAYLLGWRTQPEFLPLLWRFVDLRGGLISLRVNARDKVALAGRRVLIFAGISLYVLTGTPARACSDVFNRGQSRLEGWSCPTGGILCPACGTTGQSRDIVPLPKVEGGLDCG